MSSLATHHIAIVNGQPTTTTQDIAEVYDKRHDDVLKIVRKRMVEAGEWGVRNFADTPYTNPQNGQTYSVIRMTKKGFHFVVGKFTGTKAVRHQIAFADEFERMEAELSARMAPTPTRQAAYAQARWFLKLCTWAASMQRAALARAVDIHPSTLSRVLHGSGAYGRGCIPTHIATKVDAALPDFCPMTPEVLPQFRALSTHGPAQRSRQLSLI